jgi:TetR/AcrR family transcriptional regulator, cholesterol catabolism regulator
MPANLKAIDGVVKIVKPHGIRQERARQRRRHLSEVVMQLIQERGFDAVSVNEVAERASMSIGGLYRHIDTKSDLLEMVCDEINLDLLAEMKTAARAAHGVTAKLEAAIRVYWSRHWDSSASILVAYREYQSFNEVAKKRYRDEERQLAEYLSDLIRAGVAVDEFRAVDDRLLAHEIILLSHMRALKGWAFKDRLRDRILAEQLDLIFSRLRPRPIA